MTFLDRLAIALTPHVHHGVSTPEEAARAVLEAMRHPSNDMTMAGTRALVDVHRGSVSPISMVGAVTTVPAVWRAMINVALSEGQ